jgi:hypothetical protein
MGHPLKLPSPTKLARLGHFPPASQAGRLAGVLYYVFSLVTAPEPTRKTVKYALKCIFPERERDRENTE